MAKNKTKPTKLSVAAYNVPNILATDSNILATDSNILAIQMHGATFTANTDIPTNNVLHNNK